MHGCARAVTAKRVTRVGRSGHICRTQINVRNDIDSFGLRGTTTMWAAVSFSLVTIATAFFLAGPIVALVMTMFLSAGLMLTTHLMRRQSLSQTAGTLTVVRALSSQSETMLQRKAS
jgi:hypothetical protein